jgi:hypothetical protein
MNATSALTPTSRALIWFYSHSYFTCLWIIQEINTSTRRAVQCGRQWFERDHVDLVAGYIMDTAFSNRFGSASPRRTAGGLRP